MSRDFDSELFANMLGPPTDYLLERDAKDPRAEILRALAEDGDVFASIGAAFPCRDARDFFVVVAKLGRAIAQVNASRIEPVRDVVELVRYREAPRSPDIPEARTGPLYGLRALNRNFRRYDVPDPQARRFEAVERQVLNLDGIP